MRDLDFTSLRLFIAVCEARSISRVADAEALVASAISKRLSQLEQTVGAQLLHRSKAGVKPTSAGDALLQHAYELRDKVADIERDMSTHAETVRGQVRLFAAATAVAEFLPEDLAGFLRVPAHVHIQVDLEEHLSHQVAFGVRHGAALLGICWDVVDCEGLETREYRRDHLGIAMHREHPLAQRAALRFEDTLRYDHIGMQPSVAFQVALAKTVGRAGKAVRYRAVVANFDAAIRLAHAGLGIAVVPHQMVLSSSKAKEVRFVPLQDDWAERRFILCAQRFEGLPPAARLLSDHLAVSSVARPRKMRG